MEPKRVPSTQRVNHHRRCPICGHDSHCFFTDDNASVWCMRVAPGSQLEKRFVDGRLGYLHRLNGQAAPAPVQSAKPVAPRLPPGELALLAKRFSTALPPARLSSFAKELGVTVNALKAFGIGWADSQTLRDAGTECRGEGCWSWPMTDGAGGIIGFRLRTPGGFKFALAGASSGVIVETSATRARRLVVCEGPTDAAALFDLGFNVIGRPDCQSCTPYIVAAAKRLKAETVVLMLDADPPGSEAEQAVQRGMRTTRTALASFCQVIVTRPPAGWKDVRAAVRDGVTREAFLAGMRLERRSA